MVQINQVRCFCWKDVCNRRIIPIGTAVHASRESQSESKPAVAPIQSKAGQKSASLEFSQTPKKYRRRPLTQDEIDLVTVNQSFAEFSFTQQFFIV